MIAPERKASTDTGSARASSSVALWASAMVIAALTIVQAGRLGDGESASAGVVSEIGDLTILTASSGDDDDVLAILDRRNEILFVYGVKDRRSVELFQRVKLGGGNGMFADARRVAGMTPRR